MKKQNVFSLLLAVFLMLAWAGVLPARRVRAATFTVSNTNDSGAGSLRQAMLDANASPGLDTVTFAIGASGSQQTIQPLSALPAVSDPVVVDGWSQGGVSYAGPPLVEINGSLIAAWNTTTGLQVTGGDSTLRGLAINYFNIAIRLQTAGNNVIAGNYLGLALDGVTPVGNRTGISIAASSEGNRIGTDGDGTNDAAERNVISASGYVQQNNSSGILIEQGSDNNWIAGNSIGTDASGTLDLGNASNGITTGGITIIGTNGDGVGDAVEGNLVSGNQGHGVSLASASSGSRVAGNKIGTDITGSFALPNNSNGASIGSCSSAAHCSNITFGTNGDGVSDALEGNLISGNGAGGVFIPSGTLSGNVVAGNKIGTDISGTAALPNGDTGVHLGGDFSRLGTNNDGISDNLEGNLVSGNGDGAGNDNHGVVIPGGADHNLVAGNKIGTNLAGTIALPNGQNGLRVEDDSNTLRGNLVSGNGEHGLHLSDAFFNTVTGNLIGVAADGASPLGNGLRGVYVATNSDDNTIGGTAAGEGNTIAYNGGDGVFVDSNCGAGLCLRNTLRGNAIFENDGLGIDLAPNGLTANDPLDADTGANNLQNYPVISTVETSGADVIVGGTLNSLANTTFNLDFYASPTCDPAGNGEGAVYLGWGQVTTDGSGDASFSISVAGLAADGDAITGTATGPDGSTSEFSACTVLAGEEPISGLTASSDSPNYQGTPTHFTTTLASGTGVSYTWDFGDGSGGSGPSPIHTYAAAGDYTASVTASNSLGSAQTTTEVSILPAPTCAATPDDGATVFGSADESAVQQAVNAASSGGVVKIAGTCAGVSPVGMDSQTVSIDKPLTLAGGFSLADWTTPDPQAHPTILDAQGLGRVVFVPGALALTLQDLTLANGAAAASGSGSCPEHGCGGGLYTPGDLSLSNVTFQDNTAGRGGGAYVSGALQAVGAGWLDNTATSQRGGALEVYGDASLEGGLVQGNSALYAGGIFADAGLAISGTHFVSNTASSTASGSGGALYAAGPLEITNALFEGNQAYTGGGAVLHSPGTPDEFLAITDTQFLNNTALYASAQGGALYAGAGQSTIVDSHFEGNSTPGTSGNGGAIVGFRTFTLTGTTLTGNTAGGQGGAIYHWGLGDGGSTNLVFPLTISASTLQGNQAGTEGGGLYFRQGFAAGNIPIQLSEVVFENNTAAQSGGGAYLPQPTMVEGSTFQGNTAGRGGGAYATGSLVSLDTDWLSNEATSQRGGGLEVYGDASLEGGLVQGNTGTYGGGIFADAGLVISGTHFLSNTATSATAGSGGAVYAAGPLEITNALFEGNQSYTGAGAVLHSPGVGETLVITNTQFLDNTALNASAQGGALSAFGTTTIQSSHFEGNSTPGGGGAIVGYKAMTLTDTTLVGNSSGGRGGAIYHWGLSETGSTTLVYPLTISASTLAGNQAGAEGGGLYFRQGFPAENIPAQINEVVFADNTAALDGGGAYLPQPAVVEGSTFRGNTSSAAGGGIFASSTLDLRRSVLLGNHAAANGGGLALQTSGSTPNRVTNTVFADNTTGSSGASLFANGSGLLEVLHTTLSNSAPSPVQGIAADGADVSITNTIFAGHTVGILASGAAQVSAEHSLFHANQADTQGSVTNLNPATGDPLFLDAASGDYHLALGSAAIDTALEAGVQEDLDLDLRPIIGFSDIGADEFGDSTLVDPGDTTVIESTPEPGQEVSVRIPPGATGGPTVIRLLPVYPPSRPPAPPQLPARPGFVLRSTPPARLQAGTASPAAVDSSASFLAPVEIAVIYRDADLAGLDENTLVLAVLDEASGEWLDAAATCPTGGSLVRFPDENRIVVSTCAEGEFVLLALEAPRALFLPLVKR